MHPIYVEIKLKASWCNEWPNLIVELNKNIYFQGKVDNNLTIKFTAPGKLNNTLIIQHYNKNFGQNGQWDTKSENNKIIQDRAVELLDIKLNQISIYKYFINNCPFVTNKKEKLYTNYYGFNGQTELNFSAPVYDWIICNIVKPKAFTSPTLKIETSADNLFDYTKDIIEIAEIENILEKNADLFSKSSKI